MANSIPTHPATGVFLNIVLLFSMVIIDVLQGFEFVAGNIAVRITVAPWRSGEQFFFFLFCRFRTPLLLFFSSKLFSSSIYSRLSAE
jgi:hypothetical protein